MGFLLITFFRSFCRICFLALFCHRFGTFSFFDLVLVFGWEVLNFTKILALVASTSRLLLHALIWLFVEGVFLPFWILKAHVIPAIFQDLTTRSTDSSDMELRYKQELEHKLREQQKQSEEDGRWLAEEENNLVSYNCHKLYLLGVSSVQTFAIIFAITPKPFLTAPLSFPEKTIVDHEQCFRQIR